MLIGQAGENVVFRCLCQGTQCGNFRLPEGRPHAFIVRCGGRFRSAILRTNEARPWRTWLPFRRGGRRRPETSCRGRWGSICCAASWTRVHQRVRL